MIRLTTTSNRAEVEEYLRERLQTQMKSAGLSLPTLPFAVGPLRSSAISEKYNTNAMLLSRDGNRGDYLIVANLLTGSSKKNNYIFARAIYSPSGGAELYFDTLQGAMKKGFVELKSTRWYITAVMLILIVIAFASLPLLPLYILLIIISYPILYLVARSSFRKEQKVMSQVAALFEDNLPIKSRQATNDWLSFWLRVKTEASNLAIP